MHWPLEPGIGCSNQPDTTKRLLYVGSILNYGEQMFPWNPKRSRLYDDSVPHCFMCGCVATKENSFDIATSEEECGDNWIEKVWIKLGAGGERVCTECYYK